MARIITDLIDPQELIGYARAYDNEVLLPEANLGALDPWLPGRELDDLEFRIRKGSLNDVDAAEYRAWDTEPRMTGRPGVSYIRGSLGPVSRQIPLGEEESLRTRALERNTNDPIIDAIYDDVERMTRAVRARVTLAQGDVIDDGIVTIAENGLELQADFGRSAEMSAVAATLWTNPAAPILSTSLAYVEAYIEKNGVEPWAMLMPRNRVGNLALNAEMRDYASAAGTTPNRINRATIDSIFAAEGLPPIMTYDGRVRVDGVRTPVLDPTKVYLMPDPAEGMGNTFFGQTAEALFLRERGLIERQDALGIVAVVLQNENPVQTFTLATGVVLPGTPNPDLVMDVVVAA